MKISKKNKMIESEKTITLNMKIEIPIDEIGETLLICDDSESYPLCGYGYDIQRELRRILGWNNKISKKLEAEADEEDSNEGDIEIDGGYEKWIEKSQRWAEEKIKELELEKRK